MKDTSRAASDIESESGNELRNHVVEAPDDLSGEFSFWFEGGVMITTSDYQEASIAEIEREHVLATLRHTSWNKTRAAKILEIERSTLDRKLKAYGVSRPT